MSGVARTAPASVWPLGAALLEGPAWVPRDAALWCVDIKGRRIHRYDPAEAAGRSWTAPAQVGFCLPSDDGRFVAGLQTGLARFDPADGSFTPLLDPEPDLPGNRLNDATVDPAGRLWFGSMDDAETAATGRIYRFAGACAPMTPPVAITNGPAVSPDGRTLYHVDTLGGAIHACTLTAAGGLTDARVFARIEAGAGYPDGPVCDAEGCLWIGLYHGWAARRYSPAGELLETVRFPVGAVTKLAFGGPGLTTVFATTAAKHLDAAGRAREPHAGDLFAFEAAVPGLPSPAVALG